MSTRCICGGSCLLPIIIGILAGILGVFFAPIFTAITVFLWVAFGVSLFLLLLLTGIILATATVKGEETFCCVCDYDKCLSISIFGSLATSVIALALGTLTGTLGAVLGFLLVVFFVWMLVAFLMLLVCVIDKLCD